MAILYCRILNLTVKINRIPRSAEDAHIIFAPTFSTIFSKKSFFCSARQIMQTFSSSGARQANSAFTVHVDSFILIQ